MLSDSGLINVECRYSVGEAFDRLEADLRKRGITIFGRIDHADGASAVALDLRPTELLIFGKPESGTPLMQANQTIGIDLPLKLLGWQDAGGKVWLSYNDPEWLSRRHHLNAATETSVIALSGLLANLVHAQAK